MLYRLGHRQIRRWLYSILSTVKEAPVSIAAGLILPLSMGLLLASCAARAQTATITNITTTDLDHSSVRIWFHLAPDAYVQIFFDTVSGGFSGHYRYSSSSYPTGKFGNDRGFGAFSLGALSPATTYYFVVSTRPNEKDPTGMRISKEHSFTTLSDPGHPVSPALPTIYNPGSPDVSNYTVVSMINGPKECVAAVAVVAPAGNTSWSGNVQAGDTVQQVLNKAGYGTVLDFAQDATCAVPDTNDYDGGYLLMPKPVDPQASGIGDPKHRWIVLQTHENGPTDFPPRGFRTSGMWDSKMATFVAQVPAKIANTSGQQFQTYTGPSQVQPGNVHHYWIRRLRLMDKETASGTFNSFVNFGGNCTGKVVQDHPPSYNAIEQVHMAGAPVSSSARSALAIDGCPDHILIRDNSIEGFDAPGAWSSAIRFSDWSRGFYTIDNNLLEGMAMNVYFESNGSAPGDHNDIAITHNYFYWPSYTLKGNPAWDQRERLARNQFEIKRGRRLLFDGNIVDGQWSYQNEGSVIFLSGNNDTYTGETGITDVTIKDNIIRNSAGVFNCMGSRGTNPRPPDNSAVRRVWIANNLAYNLGRHHYTYAGFGGSLNSGYLMTVPGCQDLVVKNNTFGFTDADSGSTAIQYMPFILEVGGGAQLSEGFYFQNNIAHMSVGNPSDRTGIVADNGQVIDAFPRRPAIVTNKGQLGILNSAMVRLDGASSAGTPNAVWNGNVIIGGTIGDTSQEPWPDLGAQTESYAQGRKGAMPPGDTYATGKNMARRQESAGLLKVASNDYTCTPTAENPANKQGQCSAGADLQQIYDATGVVRTLTVTPGAKDAAIAYTAPDARACSIDYGTGADSAGHATYSKRVADSGGAVARSLSLSGLTSATTYNYRLMCYFEQGSKAGVPDGAATTGTFTTRAVAAK